MRSEDYRRGQLDTLEAIQDWAFHAHRHGEGVLEEPLPDGRTVAETLAAAGIDADRFEHGLARALGGPGVTTDSLYAWAEGCKSIIAEDTELRIEESQDRDRALDLLFDLPSGWWRYESQQRCRLCGEVYATLEYGEPGLPWGGIHEEPIKGFSHGDGCPVPAIEGLRAKYGFPLGDAED